MAKTKTPRLTEDEVKAWRARLRAGKELVSPVVEQGKKNIQRYRAKSLEVAPSDDTVIVPLDFSYVEQKKAQLFFQTPDVQGEALQPAFEPAAPIFTAVMNHALGIHGVNAKAAMFEMLTDALCPTGYGVSKIGYQPTVLGTKPVQVGVEPGPPQPGSVLGLAPTPMVPVFEDVPNIVAEKYYWDRFPPGWFRCPADFRGSDFDKAAWLSMRFEEDYPDGEKGDYKTADDAENMLLVKPSTATGQASTPKRCGEEVWYRAAQYDKDAAHPEHIRTFKLYDDDQDALPERKDSPFQRWVMPTQAQPGMPAPAPQPPLVSYQPGAQPIGMPGYPIHVLTLRYLSDAAFPPSDSTMSRQTVDEISEGRTQMFRRRKRALPQTLYDATRVTDPAILAKLESNDNSGMIGVQGSPGEMFLPLDKGNFGRDNFAFNDIAQRDLDTTWALGANAGVLRSGPGETATKSNQIQSAVDTRLEAERTRVLEYFVKGVAKLAGLYQLFADQDDYVAIVGADGAKQLVAWNKSLIAGKFAFSAKPNSHIRIDAAQSTQQALQAYNQFRKDPNCNEQYLIAEVAQKMGMDPARLYKPSQPPPEEKPTVSWAIKIEDFYGPGAQVAVEIAKQSGVVISPAALQAAQTIGALVAAQAAAEQAMQAQAKPQGQPQAQHGGAASVTEPINKHAEQFTGGTPGIGVQ